MIKIPMGVVALFVSGSVGFACSSQTGLNSLGGTTAGGATNGGQAAGGVVGSAGGSVVSGGTAGASGGTTRAGGAASSGGITGVGGSGGTIGAGGSAGSGGTIAAGGSGGTGPCLPNLCVAPLCSGVFVPNPDHCGCPICVPTPDAGIVKDASPDSLVCPGPIPPCVPPPQTCPAGTQLSSPPCGCTGCFPVDGGTVADTGKPDGPPACRIGCPMLPVCTYGYLPTPDPCSCPTTCAPPPDAGATKDAGRADTTPTACPMLGSLNSTDAARVSYSAGRALVSCAYANGSTGTCVSDDATSCPGPSSGEPLTCSNLCAADQYGLSYGGVGPLAAPPSIELPAGCNSGMQTPAGVAFYCCPCGG